MPNDRASILAQARTRITELNRQRTQLAEEARRNPQAAQAAQAQLEQRLNGINQQIQRIEQLMAAGADLQALVTALASGDTRGAAVVVAGAVTSRVIDHFIEKYNDGKLAEREFFNFGKSCAVPVYPAVNVEFGISASVKGSVTVSRDENKLIGQAALTASVNVDVALTFGVALGPIGTLTIGGGLRGTGTLEGRSTLTLTAADPNLSAALAPGTLDLKLSASIFLSMPDVPGMSSLLETVSGFVGNGISSDGNKLLYQLGSITVFQIALPTYTLTFNINSGAFSGSRSSGNITVTVHPTLRSKVQRLKQGMIDAANSLIPSWLR